MHREALIDLVIHVPWCVFVRNGVQISICVFVCWCPKYFRCFGISNLQTKSPDVSGGKKMYADTCCHVCC